MIWRYLLAGIAAVTVLATHRLPRAVIPNSGPVDGDTERGEQVMNVDILARVLHVVGVVIWIGGVAMVTTVILPSVRRFRDPEDRVRFFEQVEGRFAWQARATTLLTGSTGFYLLHRKGWGLLSHPSYWWLHAMIVVWAVFTLIIFVLEPLVLHRWFQRAARKDPELTFRRIQWLHRVLLIASLLTILGGVAGSHGYLLL